MSAQRMKWLLLAASGILLVSCIALSFQTRKIDDGALKRAEKGTEWLTYGQGYFEQRHTSMTQITPANVKQLSLAWSFELGEGGGKQEGTPLFANGIIYAQTNWSIVVAIDARTGKEIWRYDPMADRTTRMCCGVLSRGIALYEGKVLVPVNDGRMEAIDAQTGKLTLVVMGGSQAGTRSEFSLLDYHGPTRRKGKGIHRERRRGLSSFPWICLRI